MTMERVSRPLTAHTSPRSYERPRQLTHECHAVPGRVGHPGVGSVDELGVVARRPGTPPAPGAPKASIPGVRGKGVSGRPLAPHPGAAGHLFPASCRMDDMARAARP